MWIEKNQLRAVMMMLWLALVPNATAELLKVDQRVFGMD